MKSACPLPWASISASHTEIQTLPWCKTTRLANNHHVEGISEDDLYDAFVRDNPELRIAWNKSNFNAAVFTFATSAPGYDYNPQNAAKGNTKSKRKWRKGPQGAQQQYVRITHVDDASGCEAAVVL